MTIYDFDQVIPRQNTNCAKWDGAKFIFGSDDVIPMWVADMDFPVAKPITQALKKRIEHEFYGYPLGLPESTRQAIVNRMKRLYDWKIDPEWIVITPGVVSAVFTAVKAFTRPGDAVIHQPPVYYPFYSAIEDNGCHVANNQLILDAGRYKIDFEDLEQLFKPSFQMVPVPSRAKMMILCNPHNPVGRVWTKEELIRTGEIVIDNEAIMVSDEIHCEILFKGFRHLPFATLFKEFEQNSITCMAPSKTFNLAGLDTSVIIIPNSELRKRFTQVKKGFISSGNILGMVALEAAFNEGDEWLSQFLDYLQGNLDFLVDFISRRIPKIKVIKPEGTYLVWLDCRELKLSDDDLKDFMTKKAKVGLDHGFVFGPGGEGFERINIACPRSLLSQALERIEKAVNHL